jgi:hypothetical protein
LHCLLYAENVAVRVAHPSEIHEIVVRRQ